jgi:hypothetical protein
MPRVTLHVHTLFNGEILEPGVHELTKEEIDMLKKSGAVDRRPNEDIMFKLRSTTGGRPEVIPMAPATAEPQPDLEADVGTGGADADTETGTAVDNNAVLQPLTATATDADTKPEAPANGPRAASKADSDKK